MVSPHPYIPATEADRARMLARIGVYDLDALFADLPEAFRDPAIDLLPALTEPELIALLADRAGENAAPYTAQLSGRRGLSTVGAVDRFSPGRTVGILHCLHAVSARNQPGHAAIGIRVSVGRLRVDRHGRGQCRTLRRRQRHRRGLPDGVAHDQAAGGLPARTDSSRNRRRGQDVRARSGPAG